jgi:hypothetical protein
LKVLELRAADPGPFNFPVEVFSEWRGNGVLSLRDIAHAAGRANDRRATNAHDDDWSSGGSNSYFRHTGR